MYTHTYTTCFNPAWTTAVTFKHLLGNMQIKILSYLPFLSYVIRVPSSHIASGGIAAKRMVYGGLWNAITVLAVSRRRTPLSIQHPSNWMSPFHSVLTLVAHTNFQVNLLKSCFASSFFSTHPHDRYTLFARLLLLLQGWLCKAAFTSARSPLQGCSYLYKAALTSARLPLLDCFYFYMAASARSPLQSCSYFCKPASASCIYIYKVASARQLLTLQGRQCKAALTSARL